jgi:microcin C transport system substrate-binding protein
VQDWWAAEIPNYRYRFNPDKVRLQVIRDPNTAFEAFKVGEIDCHGLTLPDYWYQKLPDDHELVQSGYIEKSTFYNKVPPPTWSLTMNTSKPPLDNKDVRTGIQYACNWELVIKEIFYGDYTRMQTDCDDFGIGTHPTLKAREFDPEKAAEYFAKAGYTERGQDGILVDKEGNRLQLTLTNGYKRLEDVCTVLQQEMLKAGVQLDLEMLEMTAAWKKVDEKKHQIQLSAKNTSPELYPRFWETWHSFHAYHEDGSVKVDTNNDTMTALPELDAKIERYDAASDIEEITALAHEITEMVHDHAAFVPGWKCPFLRLGKWRWMRYPSGTFDHKTTRQFDESWVFWIDEDMKKETLEAKKKGETFPPVIEVFEQFRDK